MTATSAVMSECGRYRYELARAVGGGFTRAGTVAFIMLNPSTADAAVDPIGPLNDGYLSSIAASAELVICAWGVHGAFRDRGKMVRGALLAGVKPHHLGLTKDGHPRHPLYLKADTQPQEWS
jgi:hypothetical protein